MSLVSMLRSASSTIAEIESFLDGLDHRDRMHELAPTTRADQRALYRKAESAPALSLEHFLPGHVGPRIAVTHHGRNTLPFPRAHRFFEKVMARPGDGSHRAFGYNRSWLMDNVLGPGYFVLLPTEANPAWVPRGAWVVDYSACPDGAVPDGWPRVRPNSEGLQRFALPLTRDFMRRVSAHVSIGAAYRRERALDHYFTLCRED